MTVRIRRADAEDAPAVATVYLRSRRGAGAAFPPGVHPDDDVRRFVAEVIVPQRETWVAHDATGGAISGVAVIEGDDPGAPADLEWLFVDPEAAGRGVGSGLLDHVKARRPAGLALWVFESNVPARDFYARRGFREGRRTDGENEEGAPDIRMLWGDHPDVVG